ncbi:MAG: hypothetical protein II079_00460, partial [Oscillospiraceae bacterium]|nr:hypothetical protein [Oscillospiraceae bacterium]
MLSGLEPKNVFHFFEQLCAIPHGSYHTKAISDSLAVQNIDDLLVIFTFKIVIINAVICILLCDFKITLAE